MTHAIRFHKAGGPEVLVWEEVKTGKPGAGEARIRHTAVGLNFVDIYNRSGLYPVQLPSGLGGEGAGVVEEIGPGVTDLKPGDRVAYGAAPLGASLSRVTAETSTPSSTSPLMSCSPWASEPTRPTIRTSAPSLAAATAWLAPLPPGRVCSRSPATV